MTEADSPIFDETDLPYPRRFRWLKRLIVTYVLVALLLVGLRFWWGKHAQHRFDAEVAAAHARGEPALADDLNHEKLRDADNAAYYLRLADSKLNPNVIAPAASNYTYPGWLPYPRRWYSMAEKSAVANRAAFDDVREARRHPQAQWAVQYSSPLMNFLLPHLNGQRNIANHVGDDALLNHLTGNDAEAIERIEDVYAVSDALDVEPFFISHLVAVGIRALALNRLELMSPELTIQGRSPTTSPKDRPASREQIQKLIAHLLDKSTDGEPSRRAYIGERVMQTDTTLYFPRNSKVLWPMFQLDAVSTMHSNDDLIASATQPTWPAAQQSLRGAGPATQAMYVIRSKRAPSLARALSSMVALSSFNRAQLTDFRVRMEARLAATMLAVRLYQLDHNGQFPPTLDALVPTYLAKVPDDPFRSDGGKIGYIPPGKAAHPLVYSVGDDGVDSTAGGATLPTFPMNSWENNSADQWRDLTRWAPPPAPKSTRPVNPGDEEESLDALDQ